MGAQSVLTPLDRPAAYQVDHTDKFALQPERQLQHQRPSTEAIGDHRDAAGIICSNAIHLVDKADPRHPIFVGLAPDRLGLRLDAGNRIEYRDRAVEDPQAALDLDRKIDMAGCVDNVDAVVLPKAGRRRGGDRYSPFLLLSHPIHGGGALVHLADFVGAPGVIEDALGRRRLAGVDMRHDADVAIALERMAAGHVRVFLSDVGSRRIRLPQI